MNKLAIGGLIVGAVVFGGIAEDNAINPYTEKGDKLEIAKSSTIEHAGEVKTEADTKRPAITLSKWSGKANMTVEYLGMASTTPGARPFMSKNVEWDDGTQKMEAVPLDPFDGGEDGGMEINIHLTSKPATSTFAFKISGAESVKFCYQPAVAGQLAAEDGKDFADWCNPQWVADNYDPDATWPDATATSGAGMERPENVVGSYVVYSRDKENGLEGQTNFATGKIMDIKRPETIDGKGNKEWAILSYRDGVLYATIAPSVYDDPDTDWSDFVLDPIFGYTTIGASSGTIASDTSNAAIRLGYGTPGMTGTLDAIVAALRSGTASEVVDIAAFLNIEDTVSDSHVQTAEVEVLGVSLTTTSAFFTFAAASEAVSNINYVMSMVGDGADIVTGANSANVLFDTTTAQRNYSEQVNDGYATLRDESPWTETDAFSTRRYSIYALFTEPSRTVDTSGFTYCRTVTSNNNGYTNGIATTTTGLFPLIATSTISTLAATSSRGNVQVLDSRFQTPLDIVFVDEASCSFGASSTAIPHFFEKYASTIGAFVAHLGTSDISSTTAKVLAMYYGNSAFTTNLNSPGQTYATTSPLVPAGIWTLGLPGFATTTYPDFLDATYNGNNGSSVGMKKTNIVDGVGTTTNGYIDGAVWFSGTAHLIRAPNSASVQDLTTMSVSAWVRKNKTGSLAIVNKTNPGAGTTVGWALASALTTTTFTIGCGTAPSSNVATTGIAADNTWHFVVATWDGVACPIAAGDVNIYVDGVRATDGITAGSGTHTTDSALGVCLGATSGSGSCTATWQGVIDDVRIYTRTLSAADVQTLYNNSARSGVFWTFGAEQTQSVNALFQLFQGAFQLVRGALRI